MTLLPAAGGSGPGADLTDPLATAHRRHQGDQGGPSAWSSRPGFVGAVRPRRRPVRRPFRPAHARPGGSGQGAQRGPHARRRGARRRDAVPAAAAAPIAIMSGLSRAAYIGVVIKCGGALERLAAGQVMLFDKTGTLTQGRPGLADVVTAGGRMDGAAARLLARPGPGARPGERHRHRRHPSRACRGDAGRRPGGARTATAWRGPSGVTG